MAPPYFGRPELQPCGLRDELQQSQTGPSGEIATHTEPASNMQPAIASFLASQPATGAAMRPIERAAAEPLMHRIQPLVPHRSDERATPDSKGRVLLVDDEQSLLRIYERVLRTAGYSVDRASDGKTAVGLLPKGFDVIVSDIAMPGMDGLELLRAVRQHDLDVPIVLMTASPAVETAVQALEYGALRYLVKPFDMEVLRQVVEHAVRLSRIARIKRQALALVGADDMQVGDRAGLEASFRRALDSLWMAYQPIVCWSQRRLIAHEALVRTTEPTMPRPDILFDAAERLGRLPELGRAIRAHVSSSICTFEGDSEIFVNLHTRDLLDEELYSPDAPLSKHSARVVLEITERSSLDEVKDAQVRIARLRALGYRVAVDDLGAGYAGLTSFTQLEPEVVKLDMSLVRNVHISPTKQKVLRSMISLCKEMALIVVAEGIETAEERDTLLELGCDMFQGYFFGKPGKPFPPPIW